ncbi:SPFH domain-containing protein [Streptomyces sp. NBC_00257]|uniref:flotillin family protein n=1 Tax=unclassified Streptomyces TaxID=2593676 RepID=UPI0022533516|nr:MULTISPECIES: flotillin family protein [unclassified Streptomyces]WTB58672.1 SPFH domain-containing protein [Streptomyces sp. NBC_00826]WTH88451.1 SPFH domain-containing protein [Streptomyces sp. NBC_00825]WTH97180.1 SPFH domain-containing protein [Streptomyces sp. NBC_00822]MCX4862680.1 SPFH domain-containing protein [Streptomyces sp. NBC_00906]MCX4893917.1 SPFH domain-containing protein [Streptomyces sp. NBC_00892]
MPMVIGVTAGLVLAAIMVLFGLFKLMWRVAEPNEALVISGSKHRTEGLGQGMGFRIVTGHGTLVLPGVQAVRKMSLDLNETELSVDCVTHQGIPLRVRGVVIFKVGDDFVSIANAARRFLDQQKLMSERVHNVFAGHLRSIVGGLTVEDMIRDREKLTGQTRAACGTEMEKLGLIVDSLQIHEIEDPTGYIKNLAMPHAAAVQRDARIAQAEANRLATEAEQQAAARMSEATRDSEILQAGYQAERDKAAASSRQAGPLADAAARQEVVVQETRVAELEAQRREQQLQADVRKPADAQAYEKRTLAEGERDARISAAEAQARETELAAVAEANRVKTAALAEAEATKARGAASATATRATGEAEAAADRAKGLALAEAARAKGLAEAEAIKARAAALAVNQEAVVAQQLAEKWPEIVQAGAGAFGSVDHMVLLNGADGMSDMFAKALTMGGTGLGLARQLLATMGQSGPAEPAPRVNGVAPATEPSPRKQRIPVTGDQEDGAPS